MSNDSSTGGYLAPSSSAPSEDDALTDFMQSVVTGITGIDGSLVRPRWQEVPPPLPAYGTDWAALGIVNQLADAFPYVQHDGTGQGDDVLKRHESFELFCSFYGPNCQTNAALLCDGLAIAQNREAMGTVGIKLIACGERALVPELIKARWTRRVDVTIGFRREVDRTYPVLNILSSHGSFETDDLTRQFEAP